MFMNAVDALAILALKEPRSHSSTTHFHIPSSQNIVIDLKPNDPATGVMNQVASMCIYYGIEDIAKHRQYTEVSFSCQWDNVEVATIDIGRSSAKQHPNAAVSSSAANTMNSSDQLLAALQPEFWYLPTGRNIDTVTAFITIMNALMGFIYQSNTDVVPRSFTDAGPEWDACLVFPADGPIRTRPPFLEYRWVIGTLRQASRFMLKNRRFATLGMIIRVDGIFLGIGLLKEGRPDQATAPEVFVSAATA
ncbi:MAG: hypothetical protein Q9166_005735 [cf. Caloplaca sp. 2 TL-2023]